MARKTKQPTKKVVQPAPEVVNTPTSNPPAQPTRPPPGRIASVIKNPSTSKALGLIILAAAYSPLSKLVLSPVYGSIPTDLYHKYGLIGSSLLGFALRDALPAWVERSLPTIAFWIPTIQFFLVKYSTQLGPQLGPLVTELVTCFPLITLSLYTARQIFENVDLSFLNSEAVEEAAPSMTLYVLFTIVERVLTDAIPQWSSIGVATSRVGLQMITGVFYSLLLPRSLYWPAIPSIVLTMTLNVHNPLQRTTAVLHNTLALHNYTLIDRYESISGYLSVLEDNNKRFRVLRCDHSLLGGNWLDMPNKDGKRKVEEPIYAVFTMMEAVRLVEPPKQQNTINANNPKRALNIGLGIGTAPSALIAHGVNTTIVELDPIVYYLANKYFKLPIEHQFWIGDAADFADGSAKFVTEEKKYDYVLHDVFTGGAVPGSLFTHEFFTSLSQLLKQDGTVAINYAGDLNMPSAAMIHRTIHSVFPNCRAFREEPESDPKTVMDFTNVVYFCTHPENKEPITFRKPLTADYLGSGARQQFLLPTHELDVRAKFGDEGQVVYRRSKALKELEKWQAKSALGHWSLMRTVIPDVVWENW